MNYSILVYLSEHVVESNAEGVEEIRDSEVNNSDIKFNDSFSR